MLRVAKEAVRRKVKMAIFIRLVMNAVSAKVLLPFSLLAISVTLTYTTHLHLRRHSIISFLHFSSCLLSDVQYSSSRIYCKWCPPPSSSSHLYLTVFLSPTVRHHRPELKVAIWPGQGLQHRTWVVPLPTARVLCCSQWSCLPSPRLLLDWTLWTVGPASGFHGWQATE